MTSPCGLAANGEISASYQARVGDPDVRFRYGYKVIGCPPRLLGTTEDREKAEQRASMQAAEVARTLLELAGPGEVEWWVQQVTITASAEYHQPVGALLTEDERTALLSQGVR